MLPLSGNKEKSRIIGEFGVGLVSEIAYILQVCAQPQKPARLKFPQFYDFFNSKFKIQNELNPEKNIEFFSGFFDGSYGNYMNNENNENNENNGNNGRLEIMVSIGKIP